MYWLVLPFSQRGESRKKSLIRIAIIIFNTENEKRLGKELKKIREALTLLRHKAEPVADLIEPLKKILLILRREVCGTQKLKLLEACVLFFTRSIYLWKSFP